MSENGHPSDVAELASAAHGLAEMVRARTRRLYRDADELRRLTAQHEEVCKLLAIAATDTERTREHA